MRTRNRVSPALGLLHMLGCSASKRPGVQTAIALCGARTMEAHQSGCEGARGVTSGWSGKDGMLKMKFFLEERDWGAVCSFYAETLLDSEAMHSGKFPVIEAGSDVSFWTGQKSVEPERRVQGDAGHAVKGTLNTHWRKERATFLAEIAYVGVNFAGLQRHPGQRTIIGLTRKPSTHTHVYTSTHTHAGSLFPLLSYRLTKQQQTKTQVA